MLLNFRTFQVDLLVLYRIMIAILTFHAFRDGSYTRGFRLTFGVFACILLVITDRRFLNVGGGPASVHPGVMS